MAVTAAAFSGELARIRHDNEGLIDKTISVHGGERKIERNNEYVLSQELVGLKKHGRTSSGNNRSNMPVNRLMEKIAMAI